MPEIGNKILKADINMVDETFDVSLSGSYHLSIQTERDGLSFCIFNTVINKYIVLRNYPFLIAEPRDLTNECRYIFENDDLLGLKYKSSSHLWISSRSTFVPHHLFDPSEADTCLKFNHGALTGEQTQQNCIRTANLYNIFSCPETLLDLLRQYQPDIHLFHHTAPFIELVIARTPLTDRNVGMAVFFYSGYIDIAVVENKKLLFYNSFQINAPEDSVFYLTGVSRLFNIDLLSTKLMYVGDFKRMASEIAILGHYVDRIVECEPPNQVTYSYLITEPFRKNFINLFNLYGCES